MLIDREAADTLIPEQQAREIIQNVPEESAILRLARRLPNMTSHQYRLPIMGTLPQAYFVTGDTGLKQTSAVSWDNVVITAEELAVIVPIPEKVLDDSDYDIWAQVRPSIIEAFGIAIDSAILYGTNAPNTWPDGIVPGAVAAGNTVEVGSLAAGTDLYDEILSVGGVMSLVEEDGFSVTGHIAPVLMRSRLRGVRDVNGQPIFLSSAMETTQGSLQRAVQYYLDGNEIAFPSNGAVDPSQSLLISGDFNQMVYAIRQDFTWKILDQAVIQNNAGEIIYNLPQQDMVALRVVMRLGWALPNPINRLNEDEETRYPFGVLTPEVVG